jgi:tetratricopeptide (TPR) repeat protein
VTGSEDKTVRLWDVATGKPVREPMRHEEFVTAAGFSPDGRTVLTVSLDLTVRMWPVPATVSDEPERIRLWVETRTGLYRDEAIGLQPLSFEELLQPLDLAQRTQRHDRFDALGGPPASRAPEAEWHQSEAADGEQRGDWFAAAYHLKYLVAAEPGRVEHRLRLAKALLKLNRYRDARLEMDEALAQEPQNVEAYQLRGRAYLGERDDEHAMADANQAMQASAPQASSVNLLGEIAAECERWHNATADFKRQLTFFPSVQALYSLGAVQLGAGDDTAFRETCRQLLGNDGGSARLIDPIAAACLATQRPSTQVDWTPYVALAQKLRDEQPEIVAGHEILGACLLRAGRNSEAALELETALHSTRAGGNWSVNLFLAIAHAQLKNSGKAVEHLKSADQAYQSDRSPDWFDRLRFRRLRQEVAKLLAGAAAQPVRAQTASRPTAKGPGAGPPQSQPNK